MLNVFNNPIHQSILKPVPLDSGANIKFTLPLQLQRKIQLWDSGIPRLRC